MGEGRHKRVKERERERQTPLFYCGIHRIYLTGMNESKSKANRSAKSSPEGQGSGQNYKPVIVFITLFFHLS